MTLQTLRPNADWDFQENADAIRVFERLAGNVTIKVWGADWCGDCQRELPLLAAVLEAAGVPETDIEQFPVDQEKQGSQTDKYNVEYIPTVVVERDGTELARFVEQAEGSAVDELAAQLSETKLSDRQD